ncbi:hypothetical protein D9613_003134 [Agrocybe pediades]|uniref:cAMP-dependent protein kinase n=1 Tax=Agrocybe pediades TaxID=84607 RepID=A0A8H4QQ49_9AGAR|nr:hypothetical protein D9613_003134 [Agrocybe pediades]
MPAIRTSPAAKSKAGRIPVPVPERPNPSKGERNAQASSSKPNQNSTPITESTASKMQDKGEATHSYFTIPAKLLGEPFQKGYEVDSDATREFSHVDLAGLTLKPPVSRHPQALKLENLECLKTLRISDDGQILILLVSTKGYPQPENNGHLFALKVTPRKLYRTEALYFHNPDYVLDDLERKALIEQHLAGKEGEREVLAFLPWQPWTVNLIQALHDSRSLYMVLEYIPGCSLRSFIRKSPEPLGTALANFYFANLVCALDSLHRAGVSHCNLKTENVLIGPDGYICLTGFDKAVILKYPKVQYSWKETDPTVYTSPEFGPDAPDDIRGRYPRAMDWWACGCILYEMITGRQIEFYDFAPNNIKWPTDMMIGKQLRDLVTKLLDRDPERRLGRNVDDIKRHPWLSKVNWEGMYRREFLPPYFPPDATNEESHYPLPERAEVPGLTFAEVPEISLYLTSQRRA